ncbi:hypothetical protein DSCW_43370 [Desulfosarcina widdelii]|uniref:DNA primase/polymerase bifunctional N-terminal domain-containing protein n=1 Tax=Desulfosarcina widdelii TaxID=947919 RepID=A0A5K7Z838_9BACT|nr:bifunctional DNA primase/polymerase [Desulfosarcina widdelii]BBO76920.1 hypothetical protein DSCW_43370 [Desulfosarcina widdelii]
MSKFKSSEGPKIEDFSLILLRGHSKKPVDKRWQRYCAEKSPLSPADLKGRNCGIACGPASGCLVLDVDDAGAFTTTCEKKGWTVPETYTVETGSGGHHYYFQYPQDGQKYGNRTSKVMGFDVRGHGGQVVAPGSVHPDTGKKYIILNNRPMAKAPQWLLEFSKQKAKPKPSPKSKRKIAADDIDRLPIKPETRSLIRNGAAKGQRSEAIFTVLGGLIFSGLSDSEIFSLFESYPIGEKYRELGNGRERWLQPQIDKARGYFTDRAEDPISQKRGDKSESVSDEQLLKDFRKIDEPDKEQIRTAKAAIIRIINRAHGTCMVGGKFQIIYEHKNPVSGRPDFSLLSRQDFRFRYENKSIIVGYTKGKPTFATFADIWLKSPHRREYDGITFDPFLKTSRLFNMYKPAILKPGPGTCELFLEFIKTVICSRNEEIYEWLMDWVAWLFQNKGQKRQGTSIVARGSQGCGKGTFVKFIGELFQNHFIHIIHQNQITGRFNGHLKYGILVFVDESFYGGDKRSEGLLKGIISEDVILVENKFVDPFEIRNHCHLVIASNNVWVVPAGLEERRFMVVHVSNERVGDTEYWNMLYKQMENGGVADLAKYLLARKVKSNLRFAPRTPEFLNQAIETMQPEQVFWFYCLQEGNLQDPSDEKPPEGWPTLVSREGLFHLYERYCDKINVRNRRLSHTQLQRRLQEMVDVYGGPRKAFTVGGKRFRTWRLPPLEACRQQFESKLKFKIDWDDDDQVPF